MAVIPVSECGSCHSWCDSPDRHMVQPYLHAFDRRGPVTGILTYSQDAKVHWYSYRLLTAGYRVEYRRASSFTLSSGFVASWDMRCFA